MMAIDWEKFDKDIDSIIDKTAAATDTRLASKISALTRLTAEEVIELFPEPADAKRLIELMKVVKSAEEKNEKAEKVINKISDFAGIIVTLLEKFA